MSTPRVLDMGFKGAVDAVGSYIRDISPATFDAAYYPAPDIFIPNPGKPTLVVRFDGASDDGQGLSGVTLPRILRYEVRVYHPLYGDQQQQDGFVQAQEACLTGTDALFKGVYADPTLSSLVLDCLIQTVSAGEMADPDGNVFYGHDLALFAEVH